jgi:hypothetical protein
MEAYFSLIFNPVAYATTPVIFFISTLIISISDFFSDLYFPMPFKYNLYAETGTKL